MSAMARVIIAGEPGTAWVNDTAKIQYQLIVRWANSCGQCCQYDHQISNWFYIPYHRGCNCVQNPVPPGHDAAPFVSFLDKVAELAPDQQRRVVGKAALRLVESGVVGWSDVVSPVRIRPLAELVAKHKLSVATLTRAGVDPGLASRTWAAVHTPAAVAAARSRAALVGRLKAGGLTDAEIKAGTASRLRGRVGIGGGPSGPGRIGPSPGGPKGSPDPETLAKVAKTLGLKVTPPPPGTPILPDRPIAERIAAYTEGDHKVKAIIERAGEMKAAAGRVQAAIDAKIEESRVAMEEYMRLGEDARRLPPDDPRRKEMLDRQDVAEARFRAANAGRNKFRAERERLEGTGGVAGAIADVLAVDRPARITWDHGAFQDFTALDDATRMNADRAADWLARVTRVGDDREVRRKIGMKDGQRAYHTWDGSHIAVKPGESATVVVHELGHALDTSLVTGGEKVLTRSLEFLAHRVGDEVPVKIKDVASNPESYDAHEIGRKDKFDAMFDESPSDPYYVGKDYGSHGTEILSMGVQKLYTDPAKFAEKDPEYLKFILGILDGSLR